MKQEAGFSVVDLTPAGLVDLNGFIARRQPALGVGKPVCGRVLALEVGRMRGVVCVCDLLGLTSKDSKSIERAIAQAAGCPAKNVLLACTHTHSGPMSVRLGTVGRFSPRYVERVAEKLAAAAGEAAEDMRPVGKARVGSASAEGLGEFRCARDEPGRDRWRGQVRALRLERDGAPPITLVHMGVHPYVLGPQNRFVHPDYPGETCDVIEDRTGARAMFLPGCGADVQPVPSMTDSFEEVQDYARAVAVRAAGALDSGRAVELLPSGVATGGVKVKFGFLPPEARKGGGGEEQAIEALEAAGARAEANRRQWLGALKQGRLPKSATVRVCAMRLGPLMLIGLSAELFHDTGRILADALPEAEVLTISQVGGDVGYLPRPFAYERLTYEVAEAHQWYRTAGAIEPGSEEAVRGEAVEQARSLLE